MTFDRILHADREPQNWLTYSGNVLGHRHSALTQITPGNARNLELAWIWQAESAQKLEATALVVDGVLYTVQAPNEVVALDAETGRVRWKYRYTPAPDTRGYQVNRGLAILGDRLFMGTVDAHLIAIDSKTGKLLWNATVANFADPACRRVPTQPAPCYGITHAPLVIKDKVIVGTGGGDTAPGYGIRGFIAAFDVTTGKEAWRFYTIPGPGEPGHDTWSGDSWKTGGAGVWNTGAYDAESNLTYWGTGNPSPWGAWDTANASSRLGDNLYSDSVIALDADTGKLKWYYQFTPHDDLDWDSAQVPVLADVQWEGRSRKVMFWANRNGMMYVLDRITGEFLMGKPFAEVNWMNGFNDKGRPLLVPRTLDRPEVAQGAPAGGTKTYTARSLQHGNPALRVMPGAATNWHPPSYSPKTGLFYIPTWERGSEGGLPLLGKGGYSAVRAFDPTSGEKRWEFRVDDAVFAGVLTTASGLLFTGVGRDPYSAVGLPVGAPRVEPDPAWLVDGSFYAMDARTGRLLWKTSLGGAVHNGPMSYAVGDRQFVTVAAGHSLFAFSLPR